MDEFNLNRWTSSTSTEDEFDLNGWTSSTLGIDAFNLVEHLAARKLGQERVPTWT